MCPALHGLVLSCQKSEKIEAENYINFYNLSLTAVRFIYFELGT
jgi:hypothetical protein